jgi:hypothetical protein
MLDQVAQFWPTLWHSSQRVRRPGLTFITDDDTPGAAKYVERVFPDSQARTTPRRAHSIAN